MHRQRRLVKHTDRGCTTVVGDHKATDPATYSNMFVESRH